jgi:hypothetical protein
MSRNCTLLDLSVLLDVVQTDAIGPAVPHAPWFSDNQREISAARGLVRRGLLAQGETTYYFHATPEGRALAHTMLDVMRGFVNRPTRCVPRKPSDASTRDA